MENFFHKNLWIHGYVLFSFNNDNKSNRQKKRTQSLSKSIQHQQQKKRKNVLDENLNKKKL